jgi:hypothetical protein
MKHRRKKRYHAVVRLKSFVLTVRIAAALRELDEWERMSVLRAAALLVGDGHLEERIRPKT